MTERISYTEDEVREMIRDDVAKRGMSQNEWSRLFGRCHPSYLSACLNDMKPPTANMARSLGLTRRYAYDVDPVQIGGEIGEDS